MDHGRFELHIERAREGDAFLSRPGWPVIRSEKMFFLDMVKHSSGPWELYALEAVPDECWSFTIEKRNYVDINEMRVEETNRLERLNAARMLARLLKVPKKKTRPGGRRRGAGSGKGKKKEKGALYGNGIQSDDSASALSESEIEDEDEDADADAIVWRGEAEESEHGEGSGDRNAADGDGADVVDAEEIGGEDAGQSSHGVGGEAENGDGDGCVPPPPPPLPAGAANGGRRGQPHRGDTKAKPWGTGVWELADLKYGGIGGNCFCHRDTGAKAVCKKNVSAGQSGLSRDVLRLRMKRWLVAGIDDAAWESGHEQTTHVKMGGRLLHDFAEGLTEAQCDQIANAQPERERA